MPEARVTDCFPKMNFRRALTLFGWLAVSVAPDQTNLPAAAAAVDPGTLNHKLLMGYQGWFACPRDGSPPDRWGHWFRRNNPVATNATVDFWPDVSELGADELFPTQMTLSI